MNTTAQILTDAKKLVENPEKWSHADRRWALRTGAHCIVTAIDQARSDISRALSLEKVLHAFMRANGQSLAETSLVDWNDAPARTHAEVMMAFDKAIQHAEAQQP